MYSTTIQLILISQTGNIAIDAEEVTAQILSSKLRLKYYTNQIPAGGPYPPEGNFLCLKETISSTLNLFPHLKNVL